MIEFVGAWSEILEAVFVEQNEASQTRVMLFVKFVGLFLDFSSKWLHRAISSSSDSGSRVRHIGFVVGVTLLTISALGKFELKLGELTVSSNVKTSWNSCSTCFSSSPSTEYRFVDVFRVFTIVVVVLGAVSRFCGFLDLFRCCCCGRWLEKHVIKKINLKNEKQYFYRNISFLYINSSQNR